MQHEIKSRKLDRTLTFSRPGGGYIYVDLNGEPGALGNQICQSGELTGSTIRYEGDSAEEFTRICWNWYRSYYGD